MKRSHTRSVLSALQVFRNKKHSMKAALENSGTSTKNKKRKASSTPEVASGSGVAKPNFPKKKKRRTSKAQHNGGNSQESANNLSTKQTHGGDKPSVEQIPIPIPCGNEAAEKCFNWIIQPHTSSQFFKETWQREPLLINHSEQYFKGLFSCEEFDKILRNYSLEYGKNIDVVSYVNGKRETMEVDGRAYAPVIWDFYQNGHSIRLLNPQTYSRSVWKLCSLLQEYFGSFVGTNMYLTPPGSQGFAPHFDDIEAFVLQLEGVKHWKIYAPRDQKEIHPRFSSANFSQEEIGEPILEVDLKPGDVLYFPKGFIHQAHTVDKTHSMHLTLSTYQRNTFGDLLEKVLPAAIKHAMEEDLEFRQSLPKDYMNYMGMINLDQFEEQKNFLQKMKGLMEKLTTKYLLPHFGADQMAKEFIHSSLPPCLSESEKANSIHGNGERWENGRVSRSFELQPDTEIRIIRKRAVRLVREDQSLHLYHTFENSRVYQEKDPQYVVINWEHCAAVEKLINTCPDYIAVEKLPLNQLADQMDLATLLYDKGIVETKVPLTECDEDDEDDDDSDDEESDE